MAYYQKGTTVYQQNASGGYYPIASAPAGTYPNLPSTGYSAAPKPTTPAPVNTQSTPSSSSGSTQSSYVDPKTTEEYKRKFGEILGALEGDVNKYISELQNVAQGNYDFTAKWIEANYKEALGTDDAERANFFRTVANDLEKKIGRIAYDNQTGTYQLTKNRDLALSRLQQDNAVLTRDLTTQRMLDREQQSTALNQRGLMDSGTRQNVQGIAAKDIGQLEQDYERKFESLGRTLGRGTEDIGNTYTLGMENLTTANRRASEDQVQNQLYSTEQAQRTLEQSKKQLEAEKYGMKSTLPGIADAKALRELGYA